MVKGKYTYLILGLIIVVALVLRLFSLWETKEIKQPVNQVTPPVSVTTTTLAITPEPVVPLGNNMSQIVIENPQPGTVVSSPLNISGQARGNWFFEASLPVKLLDDKGETIASAPASAQGDWMTDSLVPFKTTLEFATTAASGYLLVTKDNPSGLPENDASIRISVRFK